MNWVQQSLQAQADMVEILSGLILPWLIQGGTLVILGLVFYLIYLCLSAAIRRQERARCFLHVLETGLRQGHSFEETIVSLARSRDLTLGIYFHLLAAYVEAGYGLGQALDLAPQFLPAHLRAMLKNGQAIGEPRKVIAVALQTLGEGASRAQAEQNNIAAMLMLAPIATAMIWFSNIFVLPKFEQISLDMVGSVPTLTETMMRLSFGLSIAVTLIWVGVDLMVFFHATGVRPAPWLETILRPLIHRLVYRIPWRRHRLQRDLTGMLGLLLDAGVPEAKAVELAAESTANEAFVARGKQVIADLKNGVKLTDALRRLDDAGEFEWRLRNAAYAKHGFAPALAGWQEALSTKAFQQEQTASQFLTTGLVLLNGIMVSLVAVGLFRILIAIVEEGVLW